MWKKHILGCQPPPLHYTLQYILFKMLNIKSTSGSICFIFMYYLYVVYPLLHAKNVRKIYQNPRLYKLAH